MFKKWKLGLITVYGCNVSMKSQKANLWESYLNKSACSLVFGKLLNDLRCYEYRLMLYLKSDYTRGFAFGQRLCADLARLVKMNSGATGLFMVFDLNKWKKINKN